MNPSATTALHRHFLSVGLKFEKKLHTKPEDDFPAHIALVRNQMEFEAIDGGYLLKAICLLETRKASCLDEVSAVLVQDAPRSISHLPVLI